MACAASRNWAQVLNLAVVCDGLRAIGIIQIQDGSLSKDVCGAEARGVFGIAFDFCGAAFVAFDEEADGVGTEGHHRGVKLGLAEDEAVRLLYVRDDGLFGRAAAAGESGEGKRCGHKPEEIAAIHAFVPFGRGLARKFVVQQFFEARIFGKLFERAPVLFAGFRLQLGAHVRQIQRLIGRADVLCVVVLIAPWS